MYTVRQVRWFVVTV